jgi:hypothetical protein
MASGPQSGSILIAAPLMKAISTLPFAPHLRANCRQSLPVFAKQFAVQPFHRDLPDYGGRAFGVIFEHFAAQITEGLSQIIWRYRSVVHELEKYGAFDGGVCNQNAA